MSQESKWLSEEGDKWFERSKKNLNKLERFDWCCYLIDLLEDKTDIDSFIELGCANGWRLEKLREAFPEASFYGTDASPKAIEDGQKTFPDVDLRVGPLSDVPLEEPGSVVIVSGVLCCLERSVLAKTVAEIDRLTKDGGYLLIADFRPGYPVKRTFSHGDDQFIYKLNYAAIFEALGTYQEVANINFNADVQIHEALETCDNNSRFSCTILHKSESGYYEHIK